MSKTVIPVAIVGAGPYGLSLAAFLSGRGIAHRIFGTPMAFWSAIARGGEGRFLKSTSIGTSIFVPAPGHSFPEWSRERGLEDFEPCSMQQFVDYGLWVQQRVIPQLEQQNVVAITRDRAHFHLTLADGEVVLARRVVIATGLARCDVLPEPFASLPPELRTHTTHVAKFAAFAGRSVAVVGAGQSALEAAALLREAGAIPTLLAREESLRWMTQVPRERPLWQRIRSPIAGLGSGPKAWFLTNVPSAVHHLPDGMRTKFVSKHLPPEGAWWLRDRVDGKVETLTHTSVASAREDAGKVVLSLRGNGTQTERRFDHVIAGTGFRIDVDRLDFIDAALRAEIDRVMTSPRLDARFESSVAGLHFIGPAAAMSFGPLFRFVVGAEHTARTLASHLLSAGH
jgi:hypothetical protein